MSDVSHARPADAAVHVLPDADALAAACADWLVARMAAAPDRFVIALSGGGTPRRTFACLADPARARQVDWSRVHVFWGDERFVPHEHPDSNYRMACETWLNEVPIPPANVHPIPADDMPADAVRRYTDTLQDFYGARHIDPARPLFDVNLLGLGEDGHTASLFPGSGALHERGDWVLAVIGERPEPRITLTLPVLASARAVVFLVQGEGKRDAVARVRAGDAALPASQVWSDGELLWFMDRAAAGTAS